MKLFIAVILCAFVLAANARLLPVLDVSSSWGGWGDDTGNDGNDGDDGNDGNGLGDNNGWSIGNGLGLGHGILGVGSPHGAPHITLIQGHTLVGGIGDGLGSIGVGAGIGHGHGHEGQYVAVNRGSVHVAPLTGHIASVKSTNLDPAPGTTW